MDIKTFIQVFTTAVAKYLYYADPFNISFEITHEDGTSTPLLDEYVTEAKMIVGRMTSPGVDREDLGDLSFVIRDTFRQMFDADMANEDVTDEQYAHYAADIWALYDALHTEHNITLPLMNDIGDPTNDHTEEISVI